MKPKYNCEENWKNGSQFFTISLIFDTLVQTSRKINYFKAPRSLRVKIFSKLFKDLPQSCIGVP